MDKGTDDAAHLALRQTLANLRELSAKLDALEARLEQAEQRFDELDRAVNPSLGQSTETPFRPSEPSSGMAELFALLGRINAGEKS